MTDSIKKIISELIDIKALLIKREGTADDDVLISIKNSIVQLEAIDSILGLENGKRIDSLFEKIDSHYKILVDQSTDIIFRLSAAGKIVYISPSVKEMLGYEIEEIRNRSFIPLLPASERKKAFITLKAFFKNKEIINYETAFIHKSGAIIPVEINGKLIPVDGINYGQGVVKNISIKKEHEKQLKEIQYTLQEVWNKVP
ncbi:MAG: hypothetical protein C0425_09205, partial [Chlorobiaceae bacterium]|nr:hypothetical protein [Chlorobiaceae bacterium]